MMRAAALIIEADHVALIERRNTSSLLPYYLFPGGHIEIGETPSEAVIREIWEELGVQIVVQQLVAEVRYHGNTQYYFAAVITGEVFGSGAGAEMIGVNAPEDGIHAPLWMPITRVQAEPIYPQSVAALVIEAATSGWRSECIRFEDEGRNRQ